MTQKILESDNGSLSIAEHLELVVEIGLKQYEVEIYYMEM